MSRTFGERVAEARKARGLTYKALGDACDLSAAYLHDIENGNRRLPPRHWMALGKALGINVADLAAAFVMSGRFEVDAADLTPVQRRSIAVILETQARRAAA